VGNVQHLRSRFTRNFCTDYFITKFSERQVKVTPANGSKIKFDDFYDTFLFFFIWCVVCVCLIQPACYHISSQGGIVRENV